ncbi:IS66 family insertion sequence element accessory protein TnpB [Bradyrhizobium sp. USDA 4451]
MTSAARACCEGAQDASSRSVQREQPFVFRSKPADRITILVWDRTGMVWVHKRLDGCKLVWPTIADGCREATLSAVSDLCTTCCCAATSGLSRACKPQGDESRPSATMPTKSGGRTVITTEQNLLCCQTPGIHGHLVSRWVSGSVLLCSIRARFTRLRRAARCSCAFAHHN